MPNSSGDPPRVAFATCSRYPQSTPDDDVARHALEARSIRVEPAVWDSPVRWETFDAVVIRSTWDYFERPAAFLDWVDRIGHLTRVWNPCPMIRWNAHKGYLPELARRGVAVVPTEVVYAGRSVRLEDILTRNGWSEAVVKPAFGGNAYRLHRFDRSTVAAGQTHLDRLLASGDALVQPFLAGTATSGERSLVFIDGVFSHAVAYADVLRENPRRPRRRTPSGAELEAAEGVLRGLSEVPLYARLDYLPASDGGWLLGELEVIEPELFFRTAPDGADRFAQAIATRLAREAPHPARR